MSAAPHAAVPDDERPPGESGERGEPDAGTTGGLLLRLVLWYALFLLPLTQLDRAYGVFYRGLGEFVVGSPSERVDVTFEALEDEGRMDTRVVMIERGTPPLRVEKPQSARLLGYLPTALFVSLTLACALSWRQRRRVLLFGLPLFSAFVGLRQASDVVTTLAAQPELRSFNADAGWNRLLGFTNELLAVSPSTGFVAAAILWVVLYSLVHPGRSES